MNFKYFALVCAFAVTAPMMADAEIVDSSIKAQWGNPSINKCNKHEITEKDFCLDSQSRCTGQSSDEETTGPRGLNLYVARTINENGAEFCPMYVASHRVSSAAYPQTYYYTFVTDTISTDDCFWVCHKGFGGDMCSLDYSQVAKSCDKTQLVRVTGGDKHMADYGKNLTAVSGSQEIASLPMFATDKKQCDGKAARLYGIKPSDWNQEHDIVLSIREFTADGHGVLAQPVQIRAFDGHGDKRKRKKIAIKPANDTRHVMCRDGYTVNESGDGCVVIDNFVCDNTGPCEGWNPENFNDEDYVRKVKEGANCWEYRCSKPGYAFKNGYDAAQYADYSCVECPSEPLRQGITEDGFCFKADDKIPLNGSTEIINSNGEVEKLQLTAVSLQQMKDAVGADTKSCWVNRFSSTAEFRDCMREYFESKQVSK